MERDVEKDLELCENATPGPWVPSVYGSQVLTGDSWNTVCGVLGTHNCSPEPAEWEDGRTAKTIEANAQFIAESREALPYYIKRCQELEEIIEDVIELFNGASCNLCFQANKCEDIEQRIFKVLE
jgi:hypothetical protein